jgi:uncharacterized cofD-like protein
VSEREPRVVAVGGGHGLAVALRAVRAYAGTTTAVVTVADDGGSSGRLRRELGVPAPGDARRCLVALAGSDNVWAGAFEHRFHSGDLEGHALGNLLIVGLAEMTGDFAGALTEAGRLVDATGRVLPATSEPVVMKADVDGVTVEGQVAISTTPGRIGRVELVPADAPAHPDAVGALHAADQIVLAPGSLYTSILPVLCVPGLRDAIVRSEARVVQVANLRTQEPETSGLDGVDHLRAVLDHGVRVDRFLFDPAAALDVDPEGIRALGVTPVPASVGDGRLALHDPVGLAKALAALL